MKRWTVAAAISLGIFSSCGRPSTPVIVEGPAFIHHTVQYPGENLALISRWYTGQATKWDDILKYNPGIDPKNLQFGQRLRIPMHQAIRRQPMPPNFSQSLLSSKRRVIRSTNLTEGKRPAPIPEPEDKPAPPEAEQGTAPAATVTEPVPQPSPTPQNPEVRDKLIENLLQ